MGAQSALHKGVNALGDPQVFVEYMEHLLANTDGAIVRRKHFFQLKFLAGRTPVVNEDILSKTGNIVSLRHGDYEDLVGMARARLDQGFIPDNWVESFDELVARFAIE